MSHAEFASFPQTYSIHASYDGTFCVISSSPVFLELNIRPSAFILLSRFSIYVPARCLLSGFRLRRMCLASLKIAWDGKGKSSHVQCYSPDSFKHGFLNLFTIISFHNASLPRLCTHMHVPYSFFSLVLSLSSLVYIPPLAFLHG